MGLDVTYVIASSKPWHNDVTRRQNLFIEECFVWVSSQKELEEKLGELPRVRYVFFLHWNWYVPEKIWQNYECVCFHMTDVPYGRGGSPLQNLIVRGHRKTKLTALRMVEEMDAGPVYEKRSLLLKGTAQDIYIRAGQLSYELMQWMILHEPQPVAQEGEPVIFQRRKPEESRLPTAGAIPEIYDYIRMLDAPTYPHAFIEYGDFVIEFTNALRDGEALKANVRLRKKIR